MRIYAGIDEAGYGPMFGPFVIARSVFVMEDGEGGDGTEQSETPCLWKALGGAVCRSSKDRRKRIAVNDSKKLYSPSTGLANLERAVLSFAALGGQKPPTLEALLEAVGDGEASGVPDLLWYSDEEGKPQLPTCWTEDQLAISIAMLRRAAESCNVKTAELSAAVIYEDRFNEIVAATRSKARCAWTFIARHLWSIWQRFGEHHPRIVVDRQGGRRVYHDLLGLVFEGAAVKLLDESDDVSCYTVSRGDRAMTISFEIDSEQNHLPVALASMTAKYVRELLMSRFNAFWLKHRPDLRPTAGYVQDGRRFLSDIEPLLAEMRIDRRRLVRSR